ncbi:MAG: hydrogen gas-evolving membrane-bound hydrogenase subunit E [Planctomycetota bacterium]
MTTALLILIIFMILASIAAVEAKGLLSTVVSVSAAGLGLSVIFLFAAAPDLAITQVVVEVVALVILIRAIVIREDTTFEARTDRLVMAVGLIAISLLVAAIYSVGRSFVPFGSPLMPLSRQYFEHTTQGVGAANYVTAILLDFRGYDTLGEATVIFVGIVGAYCILRKVGRLPHEGHVAHR